MTETQDKKTATKNEPNHRGVVVSLLSVIGLMSLIVIYSPELYNMFCKATGYGGTTQRVEVSSGEILKETITVRFDATIAKNLNWEFKPMQRSIVAHIGETVTAKYMARNLSDKPVTGSAIYNVTPEIAGSYFNKIECFCFTEQTLAAGQQVEMPVMFYVDPEIVTDKDGQRLKEITLSYVFFAKSKGVKAAQLSKDVKGQ